MEVNLATNNFISEPIVNYDDNNFKNVNIQHFELKNKYFFAMEYSVRAKLANIAKVPAVYYKNESYKHGIEKDLSLNWEIIVDIFNHYQLLLTDTVL